MNPLSKAHCHMDMPSKKCAQKIMRKLPLGGCMYLKNQ